MPRQRPAIRVACRGHIVPVQPRLFPAAHFENMMSWGIGQWEDFFGCLGVGGSERWMALGMEESLSVGENETWTRTRRDRGNKNKEI